MGHKVFELVRFLAAFQTPDDEILGRLLDLLGDGAGQAIVTIVDEGRTVIIGAENSSRRLLT